MELAVFIIDKASDDPVIDAQCYKRGDVVVAMPDGHAWGDEELSHPWWRIISVPDLTQDEADSLCVPEPGDPLANPLLQIRFHKLDLDSLTDPAAADVVAAPDVPLAPTPLTPNLPDGPPLPPTTPLAPCDQILMDWEATADKTPNPVAILKADSVRAIIIQKDPLPNDSPNVIGPAAPANVIGPS